MGKLTVVNVLSALVLCAVPSFATAALHTPIVINGNAQFTAANGVANPGAAGTAADPFIIRDWSISANGTGACINVADTDRYFELRNIGCTNASTGIVFANVSNGTILNSSISQIRGTSSEFGPNAGVAIEIGACHQVTVRGNTIFNIFGGRTISAGQGGGPAWGIHFVFSEGVNISNNRFLSLFGTPGAAGSTGNPGGGGGPASGVFGVFSSGLVMTRNLFDTLIGGVGGDGGQGTGATSGGSSGGGGDTSGISLSGVRGVNATGNLVMNLYGGFAGRSGNATPTSNANGGAGGRGGNAIGMLWYSADNLTSNANIIQRLFAAPGAAGGTGGFAGGQGGPGGEGGEAAAQRFDGGNVSITQFNNFRTIRGGSGGSGGLSAGAGQAAGGNGGNGVGLHYISSTGIVQSGNAVTGNAGGFGGPPNGQPGSSLPVLIE